MTTISTSCSTRWTWRARAWAGVAKPTVGCVIVKDGTILGEGFHQYEWRDHAEIVALKQAGVRARGATLYVTLEPCNHTGRTGPCSEAIVKAESRAWLPRWKIPIRKRAATDLPRCVRGNRSACGLLEAEAKN